jgi:hypothetical protein
MLSLAYENAIQALVELETQKETIKNIEKNNTQITQSITNSTYLINSIHSFFGKIKLNFFKTDNSISTTDSNDDTISEDSINIPNYQDDNDLIRLNKINKIINQELETQNNNLQKIKKKITINNLNTDTILHTI